MRKRFLLLALAGMVSAVTVVWLTAAGSAGAARAATQVPLGGTGSPHTGDFTPTEGGVTQDEFPAGEGEEGPDPYNGTISLSGSGGGGGPSVNGGTKAKSNPTLVVMLPWVVAPMLIGRPGKPRFRFMGRGAPAALFL